MMLKQIFYRINLQYVLCIDDQIYLLFASSYIWQNV